MSVLEFSSMEPNELIVGDNICIFGLIKKEEFYLLGHNIVQSGENLHLTPRR
jgi:hypothetical protein